MRAMLLIAVASIATQLPARDTSHAQASSAEQLDEAKCQSGGEGRPMPVADGRTFRPLSYSQSII